VYLDGVFRLRCRDASGELLEVATRCHDPAISRVRDCYLVEDEFLRAGIYRKIPVGQHYLGVIDAAGMDRCLQDLARGPRLTIYGRIWG
jgi:hypothetical protein